MSYAKELHDARKARLQRLGMSQKVTSQLTSLLAEQNELIEDIKDSEVKIPDAVSDWIRRQMEVTANIKSAVCGGEDARPSIITIQSAVAAYFGVSRDELRCKRRNAAIIYPRHVGYYLCKTLTLRSFPEIGRLFGGRDHTTIMHGVRKIERVIRVDTAVAYDVAQIEGGLR